MMNLTPPASNVLTASAHVTTKKMSDKSYSVCNHCGGGIGCDKCHQGWECTKFCTEYNLCHPDIKDDHYGLDCEFCEKGWKLGPYVPPTPLL